MAFGMPEASLSSWPLGIKAEKSWLLDILASGMPKILAHLLV
jgi:hypothetical protein